ncbi:hypothetical protein [Cytobacillus sp. NCCP-133]|uniref:hypothetical protein n=1 Tax=Cytobacillus sp. NCCP-133 TaxID=766848 RepID=UPI0022325BBA|nr:hypothetical protein [Cytobacillus sp. NCCP-133]GLB60375.1 hypothetical protein NCCP133_25070 [Cytobacillus sp. NCCP-133]
MEGVKRSSINLIEGCIEWQCSFSFVKLFDGAEGSVPAGNHQANLIKGKPKVERGFPFILESIKF